MLSYRHGFHAGNHADVLKHIVLTLILDYLKQKNKPYWFIDTHAGAGKYSLESEFSNKTTEYLDGIGKIFHDEKKPLALTKYIEVIRNLNGGDQLKQYPGSPWIASQILSHEDKIRLFELHPTIEHTPSVGRFNKWGSIRFIIFIFSGFSGTCW